MLELWSTLSMQISSVWNLKTKAETSRRRKWPVLGLHTWDREIQTKSSGQGVSLRQRNQKFCSWVSCKYLRPKPTIHLWHTLCLDLHHPHSRFYIPVALTPLWASALACFLVTEGTDLYIEVGCALSAAVQYYWKEHSQFPKGNVFLQCPNSNKY